eukprot:CAMPEP_0205921016 /NCGR_PEP_ID=MMETSP1325-20131115/12146_1 /ASSEMBLY_ACC=CAM_ASM_000708 /TAXON_ID=236786 /ORGANISM="Florenciella sp., Strain RCC1007" /LENGTH=45 /DNA_ID= /DNA_START= /DNA_END= /DNA_ORIENTATION=
MRTQRTHAIPLAAEHLTAVRRHVSEIVRAHPQQVLRTRVAADGNV